MTYDVQDELEAGPDVVLFFTFAHRQNLARGETPDTILIVLGRGD